MNETLQDIFDFEVLNGWLSWVFCLQVIRFLMNCETFGTWVRVGVGVMSRPVLSKSVSYLT